MTLSVITTELPVGACLEVALKNPASMLVLKVASTRIFASVEA